MYFVVVFVKYTVKPALVTTCIERPPLFKDHLDLSHRWFNRYTIHFNLY
jgi:hypothetical protein